MKRARLPLTALRSFESAGRLLSFTLASQELFVSQAAISRQIRELEALVGCPLFDRVHRGVRLTQAGDDLLAVLTTSFDRIALALDDAGRSAAPEQVMISCEPSFAMLWLVENLKAFGQAHPDVDVVIDADPRPIEFRTRRAEIAIRFSAVRSSWPRTQAIRLFDTQMLAIACPDLLAREPVAMPADVLRHTLLHIENRDMWQDWLQLAGVDTAGPARGPVFDDVSMVLRSVLSGHGIGLVDRLFAEPEIAQGNVVAVSDIELAGGAFFLVARDFSRLSPSAKAFVAWISAAFGVV